MKNFKPTETDDLSKKLKAKSPRGPFCFIAQLTLLTNN